MAIAYAAAVACLLAALLLTRASPAGLLLLAVPATLLALQVGRLDTASPARCLALFRSNRTVGLAVAAAILAAGLAR